MAWSTVELGFFKKSKQPAATVVEQSAPWSVQEQAWEQSGE
jgi:hypothetical protein